ncbi:hypothetical protein AB0F45_37160, partial [Streptomyces achromogenes]
MLPTLGKWARTTVTVTIAAVLCGAGASTVSASSSSPAVVPARSDSADKPVYLIHGYDPTIESKGCKKWSTAVKAMKSWGWKGKFVRVGFYAIDQGTGCTVNIAPNGDAD